MRKNFLIIFVFLVIFNTNFLRTIPIVINNNADIMIPFSRLRFVPHRVRTPSKKFIHHYRSRTTVLQDEPETIYVNMKIESEEQIPETQYVRLRIQTK